MAEGNGFFDRLGKIFSTNAVVVRSGDKLKVVDYDNYQSYGLETNRPVDRYNKLFSGRNANLWKPNSNYQSLRFELYRDYEAMDSDPIVASALDIYSDECTLKDEFGDILTIKSSKEQTRKVLHNLFYDVLNIEFNAWPWIRNLCKYGDFFLKLDITENIGITNALPFSSYEMFREEGFDPENPEKVVFKHDPSMSGGASGNMLRKSSDDEEYNSYEVAHFRLLADTNYLPYGKSMLESGRKVWKQLTLMEDAMLINRIMRAPERRVVKIDIGNIPPNEVDGYMERVISKMKKIPYLDQNNGDYNLKFNMENMLEDYYLPVRGGNSGTEIDTLSGLEAISIDDIEYVRNRLLAAFKVPKAFLGYEEGIEGKATLAAEDVRFARTIERIQRIFVSELYKIAMVHLASQGFSDADMVDFELNLTNSSIVYEQEKINLWGEKIRLASDMKDLKMLSEDWIYKNIFNMTADQMTDEREEVIQDLIQGFRQDQITNEGVDPAKATEPIKEPTDDSSDDESFEEDVNMGGRPKENQKKYGSQNNAFGRDPIGSDAIGTTKTNNRSQLAAGITKVLKNNKKLISEDFDRDNKIDDAVRDKGTILDEKNIKNII